MTVSMHIVHMCLTIRAIIEYSIYNFDSCNKCEFLRQYHTLNCGHHMMIQPLLSTQQCS